MRATALLLIVLAALPFSCGSDSEPTGGLASGCKLTSDCDAGLVCTFGRCHEECETSVDCSHDGRCVKASGDKHVCILPQDDAECTYNAMCPNPLVCAVDQHCRNQCTTARDCIDGQVCANTGVCADTDEVDGSGNLIGTRPGEGGAGGGGGDTSSGGTSSGGTSSGGTGNSGADGGDGGAAGGEPCARPLPGGGCNYCPTNACSNGECVSADGDYSCDCSPGYSGTGTKRCTLTDACEAFITCAPAYACVPTEMPGGYACQGEFATWPMPDQGGAHNPDYSATTDVVLDRVTGLWWQRVGPADCSTSTGGPSVPCIEQAAEDYCDALTLDGKSDWRLPTLIELESLLDCTHTFVPLINENAFPNTPAPRYWTASPRPGQGGGWVVDFTNCLPYGADLASPYAVRCVEGTGIQPDLPVDHYTLDSGDPETVLDNWTGLTWIRAVSAAPRMLADAQAECSSFGAGFRLPTYKELLTLVDPAQLNPAIDRNAFPGVPPDEDVSTSTRGIAFGAAFYFVYFGDGRAGANDSTALHDVRCVKP
jgi:hypothetical protein